MLPFKNVNKFTIIKIQCCTFACAGSTKTTSKIFTGKCSVSY